MLKAASAFPELRGSVEPSRAGVLVCERNPQLATMIVYKGRRPDVSARLEARYGLALPDGPRRVANGALAVSRPPLPARQHAVEARRLFLVNVQVGLWQRSFPRQLAMRPP